MVHKLTSLFRLDSKSLENILILGDYLMCLMRESMDLTYLLKCPEVVRAVSWIVFFLIFPSCNVCFFLSLYRIFFRHWNFLIIRERLCYEPRNGRNNRGHGVDHWSYRVWGEFHHIWSILLVNFLGHINLLYSLLKLLIFLILYLIVLVLLLLEVQNCRHFCVHLPRGKNCRNLEFLICQDALWGSLYLSWLSHDRKSYKLGELAGSSKSWPYGWHL